MSGSFYHVDKEKSSNEEFAITWNFQIMIYYFQLDMIL
jgi:hypothetical protein